MTRLPAMEEITMRRLAALIVVAAVAVALAAAPAGAAQAPVTAGSTYLALGDSVTFGFQESNVVPAPNYRNAAYFVAYPQILARGLHLRAVNAACPGETATSLIDAKAESNGCENRMGQPGGYRTAFPLHVHYTGSQLAFAVRYVRTHHNVRLVSLMIGANDFFICERTHSDACLGTADQRAVFASIAHNVHHILAAIRNAAHYRGQIVIVHYWSLNYSNSVINRVSQGLNQAQDTGARGFHTRAADGYGQFQRQSRTFGGNPCRAGLLTEWTSPSLTCGVHPSYAGQALLATAVLDAAGL